MEDVKGREFTPKVEFSPSFHFPRKKDQRMDKLIWAAENNGAMLSSEFLTEILYPAKLSFI